MKQKKKGGNWRNESGEVSKQKIGGRDPLKGAYNIYHDEYGNKQDDDDVILLDAGSISTRTQTGDRS